jgi:hypothetical protein
MGLVALCFLPNRPDSTSFLTEREREIQLVRMSRGISGDKGAMLNKCTLNIFSIYKLSLTGLIQLIFTLLSRTGG